MARLEMSPPIRFLGTIALCAILAPLLWALTGFVTPGCWIASVLERSHQDLTGGLLIAELVDTLCWLAGIWGIRYLWNKSPK
jgi:hypothetical protein